MRISRLLVRRRQLANRRLRHCGARRHAAPASLTDLLCARPAGDAACAVDDAVDWFEALMAELDGAARSIGPPH